MTIIDTQLAFRNGCAHSETEHVLDNDAKIDSARRTLGAVLKLLEEYDREIRRHEMRLRMLSAALVRGGHLRTKLK